MPSKSQPQAEIKSFALTKNDWLRSRGYVGSVWAQYFHRALNCTSTADFKSRSRSSLTLKLFKYIRNTRVCSVNSKPSQRSSRHVSSFKNSSALLKKQKMALHTLDEITKMALHVTFAVKPVLSLMVRTRASKNCLMTELCFQSFVYFGWVPIYIFGFHLKQCAIYWKKFTLVMFVSQMWSSSDVSLEHKLHLLLLRDGSLATPHAPVLLNVPLVEKPGQLSMARRRANKSSFNGWVHLGCVI